MKELSKSLVQAVKENPNLMVGWIFYMLAFSPMMIMEVYLMSWLNAFNDAGVFPTKDDMYHFYTL